MTVRMYPLALRERFFMRRPPRVLAQMQKIEFRQADKLDQLRHWVLWCLWDVLGDGQVPQLTPSGQFCKAERNESSEVPQPTPESGKEAGSAARARRNADPGPLSLA